MKFFSMKKLAFCSRNPHLNQHSVVVFFCSLNLWAHDRQLCLSHPPMTLGAFPSPQSHPCSLGMRVELERSSRTSNDSQSLIVFASLNNGREKRLNHLFKQNRNTPTFHINKQVNTDVFFNLKLQKTLKYSQHLIVFQSFSHSQAHLPHIAPSLPRAPAPPQVHKLPSLPHAQTPSRRHNDLTFLNLTPPRFQLLPFRCRSINSDQLRCLDEDTLERYM